MQTYSNGGRRRLLAVLGIALVLIIGIIIAVTAGGGHQSGFPPADREQSTTFQGMSSFINDGLTTDQVNYLIQGFSKFSPKAKNIAIDTNSLTPAPHNPGQPFAIKFRLNIDSAPYKGTASYSDLTSIRLSLYNLSGKKVFDSGVIPASE